MKINPWTFGLAAAGVVSLASAVQAEEATESVKTLVSSTTLSGYVNTSMHWNPGTVGGVANYSYGAGYGHRGYGSSRYGGFRGGGHRSLGGHH